MFTLSLFTLSQFDLKLPARSPFSIPDTALYWANGWIYIPRGHLCVEENIGNDFNRVKETVVSKFPVVL